MNAMKYASKREYEDACVQLLLDAGAKYEEKPVSQYMLIHDTYIHIDTHKRVCIYMHIHIYCVCRYVHIIFLKTMINTHKNKHTSTQTHTHFYTHTHIQMC